MAPCWGWWSSVGVESFGGLRRSVRLSAQFLDLVLVGGALLGGQDPLLSGVALGGRGPAFGLGVALVGCCLDGVLGLRLSGLGPFPLGLGRLRIVYQRAAGDGPPLVLLHGYVGDGPTTWRRQIEALADEVTVVAWDAPGAGGSSDPPEGFGMADYADCLAGFIAGLGLEQPHVAGLSFGGALALELCLVDIPPCRRTLVLASAYAGWGGSLSAEIPISDFGRNPTLIRMLHHRSHPLPRRSPGHGRASSVGRYWVGASPGHEP